MKKLKTNYFAFAGIDKTNEMVTTEKVIKAVEKVTELTLERIVLKSRLAKYTRPRHLLHYFLKKETKLTLSDIGKITKRDHASVIHSTKTIENEITYDKRLKQEVELIHKIIHNNIANEKIE